MNTHFPLNENKSKIRKNKKVINAYRTLKSDNNMKEENFPNMAVNMKRRECRLSLIYIYIINN